MLHGSPQRGIEGVHAWADRLHFALEQVEDDGDPVFGQSALCGADAECSVGSTIGIAQWHGHAGHAFQQTR